MITKILILGSAPVHIKLIQAAKEMGLYTIVTDNIPYEKSTGKQIADEAWNINIFDIEEIVKKSKESNVDAVISGWLDPCQRPYQKICEGLGLPCYGTWEQFYIMSNKRKFESLCVQNNVSVLPDYSLNSPQQISYPVLVKPVDSRGSRGQAICKSFEELTIAVDNARKESSNGDVLIEKYIERGNEFQVTYFVLNGQPYLIRTADSYCGSQENHMDKVVACSVSPSRYTDLYIKTTHENVKKMIRSLGLQNGPFFMQGFEDHGVFRFFDPGLRFPGVDFDLVYKHEFGFDAMKSLISIALNQIEEADAIPEACVYLNNKKVAILFPTIKSGIIGRIVDADVKNDSSVISYRPRWSVGSDIDWSYTVTQRSAEIVILSNSISELKDKIENIQEKYKVYNTSLENMILEKFDTNRIPET